jgi:3-hydroxyisobutyrate dehydrogenase
MGAAGASVQEKSGAFVESPVGGSTGPGAEGKLLALVGGDQPDLERAMPILAQLCRRIEHVGPVGSGATMKLAVNLPLLVDSRADLPLPPTTYLPQIYLDTVVFT